MGKFPIGYKIRLSFLITKHFVTVQQIVLIKTTHDPSFGYPADSYTMTIRLS